MSNKIIEEQRRAREEFVKLKKLQHGEIAADTVAEEIVPKTFKEKVQNYWYHFKWHTIAAISLTVVIAIMVTQCATREKYDFITVLFTYTSVMDGQAQNVEEYLEQYASDIDGDGKVNVQVVNCSFNAENGSAQMARLSLTKLQSMIAAEPKAILFIFDDKGEEYLNGISESGILDAEAKPLGDDFYNACEGKEAYEKLPEGLKISYRKIGNTTMEKDKTAKAVYGVAKETYNKITNKEAEVK